MPPVDRANLPCSHAWIAFEKWTPPFTPEFKCSHSSQPGTGSCPRFDSVRRTSSRRESRLRNTARPFPKDELAPPMLQLFATYANVARFYWERRSALPSHISRPHQPVTRGTWSTRRAEAPAGRQPPSRRGWYQSLLEPRPRGRCCGRLPFVALPDS